MSLRTLIMSLLVLGLLSLPSHEPVKKKDPWLELEKGLKLCGVENILYQTSCLVDEGDGDRIITFFGAGDRSKPVLTECRWSMQPGYEKGESLLQISGSDRLECANLWQRMERAIGCRSADSSRSWSVEGYLVGDQDPLNLGTELINSMGGRLQSVYANNRLVQLASYLPRAGEGFILDEKPVNLLVELYSNASTGRVRIRLGIPVLYSAAF